MWGGQFVAFCNNRHFWVFERKIRIEELAGSKYLKNIIVKKTQLNPDIRKKQNQITTGSGYFKEPPGFKKESKGISRLFDILCFFCCLGARADNPWPVFSAMLGCALGLGLGLGWSEKDLRSTGTLNLLLYIAAALIL